MKNLHKHIITIIFVIFFIGNIPLYASESNHYAAANQLSNLLCSDESFKVSYKILAGAVMGAIASEDVDARKSKCSQNDEAKPYCDILVNVYAESLKEMLAEIMTSEDLIKKLRRVYTIDYMDNLTEKELQEALRFYRSEIGKKMSQFGSMGSPKNIEKMNNESERIMKDWLPTIKSKKDILVDTVKQQMQIKFQALQKQGKLPKDLAFPDFLE